MDVNYTPVVQVLVFFLIDLFHKRWNPQSFKNCVGNTVNDDAQDISHRKERYQGCERERIFERESIVAKDTKDQQEQPDGPANPDDDEFDEQVSCVHLQPPRPDRFS